MSYNLFIDDERQPTDVTWAPVAQQIMYHSLEWVIARNFAQVAELINHRGMPKRISFDHDLGNNNEPTGYDIAQYLVEMDLEGKYMFADNFEFWVHSMNPVGRENIQRYLTQYLEFKRDH